VAYWVLKGLLTPIFHFFWRVRTEGLEHVPTEGPLIVACNHLSFCDSLFLPLVLRRRLTFVAKAEYFEQRRTAWFFRAMGQIPIKRGGGSASKRALDSAAEVLEAGGVFGIYPEGTRTPDGQLHKGHTGVARLALRCHGAVVPAGIVGTREIQPIGKMWLRPFMRVTVRFGRPLTFDHYADRAHEPHVLRQITDEIMFEIRGLTGQEYVNAYAKRKEPEGIPTAEASEVLATGVMGEAGTERAAATAGAA
jgi:1-acyl-sn-glycerol-3-phosphate acyltransferase